MFQFLAQHWFRVQMTATLQHQMEENKQSTKETWEAQGIAAKLIVCIIGAIVILGFIAPYIHLIFNKSDAIKVFGFRNMRSFLYALGVPISLFTCSSLFLLFALFPENKKLKKYIIISISLFIYNSFFQFIWIFWASTDLSKASYYTSIAVISLVSSIIYYFAYKRLNAIVTNLKLSIRKLFTFIFNDINDENYIKKSKRDKFAKERIKITDEIMDINE